MTTPATTPARASAIPPVLRPVPACLAFALLTGCASPGTPRPPSLHIPERVSDLQAERLDNTVLLHWTTPSNTTDGVTLRPPVLVDLCRDPASTHTATPPPCTVIQRLHLPSGASSASDVLPPNLLAEPSVALAYRLVLPNPAGHSAGPSNIALAASGPAPAPVANLQATSAPLGARLTWQPVASPAATSIELLRTTTTVKPPPSNPPHTVRLPGSHPSGNSLIRLLAVPAGAPDRGGAVDPTAMHGQTYLYRATRLRTVHLDGATLTLHVSPSAPVSLLDQDVAAPAPPTGLRIATGPLSADLSWQPNFEPDLAGYLVERSELAPDITAPPPDAAWQRLTPTPLTQPAFHDVLPHPGRFAYRLLAVDTSGNSSPPSPPVLANVLPSTP